MKCLKNCSNVHRYHNTHNQMYSIAELLTVRTDNFKSRMSLQQEHILASTELLTDNR
jgi:hypothetical protein